MKCGRIAEIIGAIWAHKQIDISDKELSWLKNKGFVTCFSDTAFQAQKKVADEYEAVAELYEQKNSELSNLKAEYIQLEEKLGSELRCWWVGKKVVASEKERQEEISKLWESLRKEVEELDKQAGSLSTLSYRLSRYFFCHGVWIKATPAGVFIFKNMREELKEMPYEQGLEIFFFKALAQPELKYKYSY